MAAASYTTDLTTLNTAEVTTGWSEPTNFAGGALTIPETDYFIQNTGCVSKNTGTTTPVGVGAIYSAGTQTVPTDGAFLAWVFFGAPNAMSTEAAGGMRLFVGSANTAFKQWHLKGSDTYQYGGWINLAVDPSLTADATVGTPTATTSFFGAGVQIPGPSIPSKGNPFGLDVIRIGRCESRFSGGDLANGYAVFSGYAAQNDALANRWGLLGAQAGGYSFKGLMVLGYVSAVDFRDANVNLVIEDTKKVSANFNKIEVRQAGSRVDWTNVNITSLGTVARGNFEAVDDADINIDTCVFTDMGTFIFKSVSTVLNTTFRRTGQISQNAATFTNCIIDKNRDAVAMLVTNFSGVTNSTFISNGTGHALRITLAGTGNTYNYTLTNLTFTGYAAFQTGGTSTGNEAVWIDIPSGNTVNISADSTLSYRTSGATVNVTIGQKTLTLTDLVSGSDIVINSSDTNTPLVDVNQNSGSTYAYSYAYSAGTYVDIKIMKAGYLPYTVYDYLLPNASTPLPIAQRIDRGYQP